jgi:transposase
MIRIRLSQPEAQRLDELFRATDDRKLRDRLQVVLLAHKGRPRRQIASDLAIHRRSVTRWLNAYCAGGLGALMPKKPKGKPGNIPAGLADEVKAWVIGGPASVGLDRANWTHEEIADHLYKARGIQTSRSAVQRFCAKVGVRVYRPSYHYERGDPAKQEAAKADLAGLEKKSPGGRGSAAQPGRGALADGAHAGRDAGGQGAPAQGGHARLQGRAVRLLCAQPDLGGAAQ